MANPPRNPPPGSQDPQDFADRFAAATADLESIDLVDLDGDPSPSLDPSPASSSAAPGAANLELAVDRDPNGVARPPAPAPGGDSSGSGGALQLDFEKAGISHPMKGQAAPGEVYAPAPEVEPNAVGLGLGSEPPSTPGTQASPAPRGIKIGLFGSDRVTGFLIAAAIGLLVGIYPALQASRSLLSEQTEATVAELEESVERPLAVRAGKLRPVAQIRSDLDVAYEASRSRFWVVWLGVAFPLALVLGFIRRRA